MKTVAGIRIGILGLTTPNIPNWEPARNRPGLRWEDPVETAERLVPVLRGKEKCDFVVVLVHSGPEVDLRTGRARRHRRTRTASSRSRRSPGSTFS